ncbi:WYL domain-containing protein [Marinobacterium halophilum]|uniref:WYL domain-containing protein n=1 Tax=Marinobacterium halophilum TaxID=267374 RepID=A0A2P8EK25_9GAMM|nr:WYL domain-containing protein [Marinobacterium halophilum]PSL09808.1 WYL domain-containing protein [Marinobacterium halophilum]
MPDITDEIVVYKPEQVWRYWLIELVSYWEGSLNATRLARICNIGRQQATADLKGYRLQRPDNLYYNSSLKTYLPTQDFQYHWISGDVAEYLSWVSGKHASAFVDVHIPCQCLQHPSRNVPAELMRKLVRSIREQRRIEVDYVSLTNPDHDGRVIVPHTFVNTGLRWHLRAWCEKAQAYRDFVLSRFRPDASLLDVSPNGAGHDEAWNTEVTLVLKPDPRLAENKRTVLVHDYSMQDGELRLKTRAALAQYLLQEMHINHKILDGNPDAQQLILANLDDVRRWLF